MLCGLLLISCSPLQQELLSTPTEDVSQPLDLENFSAALKGKGVHGGMVCISYDGNPADLIGLSLKAFITRQEKYIEFGIPLEEVDGEMCFEITDSRYLSVSENVDGGRLIIPDDPLTLRITGEFEGEREILNNNHEIDLGAYKQFPFLTWIYPEGVQAGCVADSHYRVDPFTNKKVFYPAWDIIPEPSKAYPTIVGTPVLAPIDGIFYVYRIPSEDDEIPFGFNAIMIYSEDTGYLINLTHEYDLLEKDGKWIMLDELSGKTVQAGEQIGVVGPKDWGSTIPHTHMQVTVSWVDILKTNSPETIYGYLTNVNHPNIDFLAEELFLDEGLNDALNHPTNGLSTCQDYPWGEVNIPQELPIIIDGYAGDWFNYSPVLTDNTGDSQAEDVLELTELYIARDTNYLYLMLKAGEEPAERLQARDFFKQYKLMRKIGDEPVAALLPWEVSFFADFMIENTCGGTDWEFQISSELPGTLLLDNMVGCDDSDQFQSYPAEFVWGDVLEVRILLAYLDNPPEINVFQVKSYVAGQDREIILNDVMP